CAAGLPGADRGVAADAQAGHGGSLTTDHGFPRDGCGDVLQRDGSRLLALLSKGVSLQYPVY
ncbi:MAG TPA: hypothetical protein VHX44_11810, partial [Planctomycetota bacterium]|nr:hypothetical protein [Planctomycetota bacterium]